MDVGIQVLGVGGDVLLLLGFRRMELAKRLVLTTTLNVAEIAWSIGYENISHFRRLFALHIGVTPGTIRRAVGIQQRA